MATALDREVRRLLDKAVRKARVVAEDGARKALTELGVEDARKPDRLSSERADLRNRLRAHAQSLGDVKIPNDSVRANRLVREIAYEHWHRALFARFLAENNLLIDPDHKVAVSLSELEEIAKEEGRDLVELAAEWAEPMLPQIFRKDDPVLALALPPETKAGINEIVKGLPRPVFAADDSLGWVYQFWQADQKDRVNDSEVKIGADELPAVTQLFTEDYMVLFLLENTLGAWWAGKALAADPALAADAASEEELREKTSPPGYRWTYLRFVREPREGETHETATGPWRPAAGAFEGWKAVKEITVLDPCMGSGHFLVFALPILVAFYRAEDGLDERAAIKAVLADNLFGLEIDPRCTQIAAFALALASWKRLGGPEPLPRLNLACSGLAIGLGKAEFLKLAEKIADAGGWGGERTLLGTERLPLGDRAATRIRGGLERLYELFESAPLLGSLIDPRRAVTGGDAGYGSLLEAAFDNFSELLQRALDAGEPSLEARELAVTAQGLAKAAELLATEYALVTTNVPFLGSIRQNGDLGSAVRSLLEIEHADLATALIERGLRFLGTNGCAAVVSPEAWLTQPSYRDFRVSLIPQVAFKSVVKLGAGAFEEITGEVVKASLTICIKKQDHSVTTCWNAAPIPSVAGKSRAIRESSSLIKNRDALISEGAFRIIVDQLESDSKLGEYIFVSQGLKSGDDSYFVQCFWEAPRFRDEWRPFLSVPDAHSLYSGRSLTIRYGSNGSGIARDQGKKAWGTSGVGIGQMSSLPACVYMGEVFDSNVAACSLKSRNITAALIAYARSGALHENLRKIDSKMGVNNGSFLDVEFDLPHWDGIATTQFPNGIPRPHTNDPTQWLFDGHPRGSADPNVGRDSAANPHLVTPHGVRPGMSEHPLQVAVARLLSYRWPRQTGSSFMDCPAVPELDEVDHSDLVDSDGIVPLPALAGEADAATRLRDLIRAVWSVDYREGTIRELLAAEDAKATDLDTWLADEFFEGHCKLFHQTPFIWHVWDGVRGGFSALVNYHRLCADNGAGRRLLEKLRDSYLGEWIAAQRRSLAAGEAGAEERLIAAEHLRGELTKIIEGEPPFDIFVRWKSLSGQPIGWEPDIDDGVRLNIRPFLTGKPKNSGRKDGCILRVTPRVQKYAGADRGAEPHREKDPFPWFWAEDADVATCDFAGGSSFKGRRYNDFHYTKAFKQRARDAKTDILKGVA